MSRPFHQRVSSSLGLCAMVALALTLAACGGGGSGGSDPTAGAGTDPGTTTGGSSGGTSGSGDGGTSGWRTLSRIGNSLNDFDYDFYQPSVAINSAGTVVAAWVEEYSGGADNLPRVWANIHVNDAWGAAFQLSTDLAHSPAVALNANGHGVAVYVERVIDTGGGWNDIIWARRYVNGTWEAAERVSHGTGEPYGMYAYEPQVGLDADGNALVVWRQSDNTATDYDGVFASRHDGTGWSTPERLDSLASGYAEALTLAVSANGTAAVVWIEDTNPFDPSEVGGGPMLPNAWARIYASGAWQSGVKIGSPDLAGFDGASRPQVTINANGDAAAVWEEHTSAYGYRIMESRYSALGGTWSTAAPLAASSTYLSWPSVAIDPTGNVAAAWSADDPATGIADGILRHYDGVADNWSGEIAYENAAEDLSGGPQLGTDANGNVSVAWLQDSAGPIGIDLHVRRYIPSSGFEPQSTPGSGYEFAFGVNDPGQAALLSLRTVYSSNPVGFFNAAWAALYAP